MNRQALSGSASSATSATARRHDDVAPRSTLRCLTVWATITAVAAAGTALGVGAVADQLRTLAAPTSIDQALVAGSGVGAAVLCPWLWLLATASVLDALRGRVPHRAGWTRRLTLLACGVAVSTSVVIAPAQASSAPQEPGRTTESASLSGLPYPDRASSRQHVIQEEDATAPVPVSTAPAPERSKRTDRSHGATATATADASRDRTRKNTHVVRAGDTLWAIAAADATDGDVPTAVAELHRRNRRVIGDDPDLIRPGQVLDLHSEGDESR